MENHQPMRLSTKEEQLCAASSLFTRPFPLQLSSRHVHAPRVEPPPYGVDRLPKCSHSPFYREVASRGLDIWF